MPAVLRFNRLREAWTPAVDKGERRFDEAVEEGRYYRVERANGSFQRRVTLPQGVKADEITATFESGVLTVRVPKADEVRPRKIVVAAPEAAAA